MHSWFCTIPPSASIPAICFTSPQRSRNSRPQIGSTLKLTQESIRQAAESTPGVVSASVSDNWVPPFRGFLTKVSLSGSPNLTDAQASIALVSFNMFSTLRTPLLSGRFYTREEAARGAHVAVVNRAFVKQLAPGGNVLQQAVRVPGLKMDIPDAASVGDPDGWLQIVGVVDDTRNNGLDKPVEPAIFIPDTFILDPHALLIMRAEGDTIAAARAVETSLRRLNPELVIQEQHDFNWLLENQAWGRERFLAFVFALFAGSRARPFRRRHLQRRLLHRVATNSRVWRAHGSWRSTRRCRPPGLAVVSADRRRRRGDRADRQPCFKQAAGNFPICDGAGPRNAASRFRRIAPGSSNRLFFSSLACCLD